MPVPMAASTALSAVLTGPPRPVTVVGSTARAWYLRADGLPAFCLATPDAVRVPCALLVPALPAVPDTTGTVGDGSLRLGCAEYKVARWWRPPRPRGLSAATLAAVAVTLASRVPAPPPLAVDRLLGAGPGLTPYGDDVLAGALVTLAATGSPRRRPLARRVRALAPTRTTAVSAALLWHAARGECVPELADLLAAPDDGARADALLRVGHSSGAGLAQGVLAAAA
jgi:Protein of unknown function (DUF2877)